MPFFSLTKNNRISSNFIFLSKTLFYTFPGCLFQSELCQLGKEWCFDGTSSTIILTILHLISAKLKHGSLVVKSVLSNVLSNLIGDPQIKPITAIENLSKNFLTNSVNRALGYIKH